MAIVDAKTTNGVSQIGALMDPSDQKLLKHTDVVLDDSTAGEQPPIQRDNAMSRVPDLSETRTSISSEGTLTRSLIEERNENRY